MRMTSLFLSFLFTLTFALSGCGELFPGLLIEEGDDDTDDAILPDDDDATDDDDTVTDDDDATDDDDIVISDDDDATDDDDFEPNDEMIEIDGSVISYYTSAYGPEGYNDDELFYLFPGTDELAENPACLRGEPWPLRWEESLFCVEPIDGVWSFDFATLDNGNPLPVGTYRYTTTSEMPVFAWGMYGLWDWAWDDSGDQGHPAVYDNDGDGSSEVRSTRVVWNGEVLTAAGN